MVTETGKGLVITVNGFPEFVIVPLRQAVPLIQRASIAEYARKIFTEVTAIPAAPGPIITVGVETLRRNMAEQRRLMRADMTPILLSYYHEIAGVIFPIPYNGDLDTAGAFVDAWYPRPTKETQAQ